MTLYRVPGILELPSLDPNDRLHAVLAAALDKLGLPQGAALGDGLYWEPEVFGFDRVSLFQNATQEQRHRIVRTACTDLLTEAWFIEKSGLAFAAKMSLTSSTIEERMLYDLFAADEASHFHLVDRWLPERPTEPSQFHRLLAGIIDEGERETLVFLIQVLLEGWGLRHYRELADTCHATELAQHLQGIVQDETRHHGSGVMLFHAREMTDTVREQILAVLERFLFMVRMGPQSAMSAIESEFGPLDRSAKLRVFDELDGQQHAQERLNFLAGLMRSRPARPILDAVRERGWLQALDPESCV